MKISRLNQLLVAVSVVLLLAMGATIWGMLQVQDKMVLSEMRRQHEHDLARELLQTSEDLTRLSRSFVATGDPAFEQHYHRILDIRNGQQPRPQVYSPTYWHLAGVGRGDPVPMVPAITFKELMLRGDFRDNELALLEQSQALSDALAGLEIRAIALRKGLFVDSGGQYAERGAPDPVAATQLLFDAAYEDVKARIMEPLQRFTDTVDARNDAVTRSLRSQQRTLLQVLVGLVAVALAGLVGFAYYNRKTVLKPLQQLRLHVRAMGQGDYGARCDIAPGNELSELGHYFNAMARAIEDDVAEREATQLLIADVNEDLVERELMLQQIMDTSSVSIFLLNTQGDFTHVNRRMGEMFRCSLEVLKSQNYVDLVDEPEREASRALTLQLLAGELDSTDVERRYQRADGSWFWGHQAGRRLVDANGQIVGLVGVLEDITDKKLARQRQQSHSEVLHLLSEKAPLSVVLERIVRNVEAIHPDALCSVLLLDADGIHLRHGAAPSLPDFFTQAIDGVAIGVGVGSCGTAAFTKERVVVDDIASHPWWVPYRDIAQQAQLGACWSQPVLSAQGDVLGTFAIYHRLPTRPEAFELDLIEGEAQLTALAIEKNRADARLQLAASVFDHARECIVITDAESTIVEVNEMFSLVTGYTREEAVGQNSRALLQSGRHSDEFYAARRQTILETGFWVGEVWNQRKNGEVFAEMLTISLVRDAQGGPQNFVALFTDITPMKEHQRQLEHIAHFDSLTNLPNRVLLADRLHQALSQCQRRGHSVAVVYLDLDGFKAVNDAHGHAMGDELLVVLAQRMKSVLREGDTLARIGGDEFVAVLVDLEHLREAEPLLQRLLKAASDPVDVAGVPLRVSASVGVTIYPQDNAESDLLLRHADQAMYVAKQAGKNRYHLFDVAQDAATKHQHEDLDRIRHALVHNEFVLFYQPKVNMQTGAVMGAEALIRWQHPERGLLPPAAFLSTIENHAFSIDVGEWVIATALQQMAQWQAHALHLPVSVNIGARQLQQPQFSTRLAELLARFPSVAPHSLELEILETSALEDLTQVCQTIIDCQAQGVRFALDDFGTGYSSLSHLRHLPAEVIKVDQSFVRDMLEDPNDLAIVKGVIGLAAAFRREVIAEGVETIAHGTLLLGLGCPLAQGYGIARPMPASAVPDWVAQWRPDSVWASA
jgi:diguanylate cyclase (GGDEF)-like protein/PAS domain S-box-containing protein